MCTHVKLCNMTGEKCRHTVGLCTVAACERPGIADCSNPMLSPVQKLAQIDLHCCCLPSWFNSFSCLVQPTGSANCNWLTSSCDSHSQQFLPIPDKQLARLAWRKLCNRMIHAAEQYEQCDLSKLDGLYPTMYDGALHVPDVCLCQRSCTLHIRDGTYKGTDRGMEFLQLLSYW